MQRRQFIATGVASLSLTGTGSRAAPVARALGQAPDAVKPATRAEATAIVANARRILTPNGVERLQKVAIGGIDQWVSGLQRSGNQAHLGR